MKNILYKLDLNNNPVILGTSFITELALQDPLTGNILTNLQINYELIAGNVILTLTSTNMILISCNYLSNVIIRLTYTDTDNITTINYISFVITKNLYEPTTISYLNIINSELPKGIFNNSPLDTIAFANLLIDLYNFGQQTFDDAFPSISTNTAWIGTLWSLTQPLYIGNPNFLFNKFITFLRNIPINCTLNTFDLAWNISKFLYFISGTIYYVYANETNNGSSPNYTIYILDPNASLQTWILGTSILGTSTILGLTILQTEYQNAISFFVNKIIRASTDYTIDYNATLTNLGLINFIDNTYRGDIRLAGIYCIAYNLNNFTNATAYIINNINITDENDNNLNTENNINIITE